MADVDYHAHYGRLIARARGRVLDGYCERHHVLPRCLGGSDEKSNLVDLTPEEHYVAHQLLVKMNPADRRLAHAAFLMANLNNKMYGWVRRRHSLAVSEQMRGNSWRVGHRHTTEHKAYLARINTGKKMLPEAIERSASKRRGKMKHTADAKARISAAKRGIPSKPEHIAKRSAALKGRVFSEAHKAKISAAHMGKRMSDEARAKMSASHTGKKRTPHTEETKAKMAAAQRARFVQRTPAP